MKSKADKAIPLTLVKIQQVEGHTDFILGQLLYDIRKLRRVDTDELTEILFQKTIDLYPFAVVDKAILRGYKQALISLWIPTAPGTRIIKIAEGEWS